MTKYHFTFLNCSSDSTEEPEQAAAALVNKRSAQNHKFHTILTSPNTHAKAIASIIRQKNDAELVEIPLWGPRQDNEEDNWQLYHRTGKALQSLFKLPLEKYLIVTHPEITSSIISAVFGGTTEAKIDFTHATSLTLEFDTELLHWRFRELIQPNTYSPPPPDTSIYQFTFVRHGESLGNINRVFQGQKEYPLSEYGLKQAHHLAEHLAQKRNGSYRGIFSSPQERAFETALAVSDRLGLTVQPVELLKEINNGAFAGKTREELDEAFPHREQRLHPFLPLGEDGESWWELYLRGGKALQHLLESPPGRYLVIAHGAILNAVVWSIFGIAPQPGRLTPHFHFDNTGIANFNYDPTSQNWVFVSLSPGVLS